MSKVANMTITERISELKELFGENWTNVHEKFALLVFRAIEDKWPNSKCLLCEHETLSLQLQIAKIPLFEVPESKHNVIWGSSSPHLPNVCLVCGNCGNTIFLNLVALLGEQYWNFMKEINPS